MVERDGKLVGLVYPDYDALDRFDVSVVDMESKLDDIRTELNKLVAPYERISKIILMPNEFEKDSETVNQTFSLYCQMNPS